MENSRALEFSLAEKIDGIEVSSTAVPLAVAPSVWQDLSIEKPRPEFDPQAFAELVRKGTVAWKDVEDPVAWVREQRGK